MALSEERIQYYTKLIKDYEEFLNKPHSPEFYTVIIDYIKKTNEQHIKDLISNAYENLISNGVNLK